MKLTFFVCLIASAVVVFFAFTRIDTKDAVSQPAPDLSLAQSNFDEADPREISNVVSELSGKMFIFHPSVDTTLSVVLPISEGPDAVYQTFISALQAHGFVTDPHEHVYVYPAGVQPVEDSGDIYIVTAEIRPLDDGVRALPVYENGWIMGIRVYPGSNSFAFDSLGFEPGDLIVAYEGRPLLNADDYADLLGALDDSEEMSVSLYRNGKLVSVQLP